ncbi:hypothetical protein KGF54_005478 [Candida jiufengensis]|uniref:uncharacterized protein n=1 Tax=Candida jiufengensis TaxID=497108 RepID=UPI002225A376|nr:uncharacterized protein KGF54_005478 [Candida jiufengensis]KAI5949601.1 hypothetical protein KGF54_005478 [Candida jiufengensis]
MAEEHIVDDQFDSNLSNEFQAKSIIDSPPPPFPPVKLKLEKLEIGNKSETSQSHSTNFSESRENKIQEQINKVDETKTVYVNNKKSTGKIISCIVIGLAFLLIGLCLTLIAEDNITNICGVLPLSMSIYILFICCLVNQEFGYYIRLTLTSSEETKSSKTPPPLPRNKSRIGEPSEVPPSPNKSNKLLALNETNVLTTNTLLIKNEEIQNQNFIMIL